MKLAIIVLSGGITNAHGAGRGYDDLVQTVRDTWAKNPPQGVDIFYNYALIPGFRDNPAEGETKFVGDILITGIEETYANMNKKVLRSFAYFADNTDYDMVFRCCCGSYIRFDPLFRFLEDKPKTNFYCGFPTQYNDGSKTFPFASGSGFFLSRDLMFRIRDNLDVMTSDEVALDDSTIGYHFHKWGIPVTPGRRRDIGDLPEKRQQLLDIQCISKSDLEHYHFHMRHYVEGMQHLHGLFANERFC